MSCIIYLDATYCFKMFSFIYFFKKIKSISLIVREREREIEERERQNKRDVLRRKQMDCEYGRGVELARRTGM